MSLERYQPQPEEYAKAEEMMSAEQKHDSAIREEGFLLGQKILTEEAERKKPESIADPELLKSSVGIIKLESQNLTARLQNILNHANILTIEDLVNNSVIDLLRLKGFGRGVQRHTEDWLKERGLKLKPNTPWVYKPENDFKN